MDNVQLVDGICMASVPLRESLRVHMRDYGVLIPHVFMAEVLRRVGYCLSSGITHGIEAHGAELEGILEMLERAMTEGDRETRNVVALSFARDSETELFFDELLPMLGPKTRAQVSGR